MTREECGAEFSQRYKDYITLHTYAVEICASAQRNAYSYGDG
jgi:hypothetical protein